MTVIIQAVSPFSAVVELAETYVTPSEVSGALDSFANGPNVLANGALAANISASSLSPPTLPSVVFETSNCVFESSDEERCFAQFSISGEGGNFVCRIYAGRIAYSVYSASQLFGFGDEFPKLNSGNIKISIVDSDRTIFYVNNLVVGEVEVYFPTIFLDTVQVQTANDTTRSPFNQFALSAQGVLAGAAQWTNFRNCFETLT